MPDSRNRHRSHDRGERYTSRAPTPCLVTRREVYVVARDRKAWCGTGSMGTRGGRLVRSLKPRPRSQERIEVRPMSGEGLLIGAEPDFDLAVLSGGMET